MRIVIDRIEGAWAVLEIGEERIDFPVAALPVDAGEGAALELRLVRDGAGGEAARLDEAKARLERLRARTPAAPQDGDDDDVFEL